jgi:membrane-associated protease RseP (regulator of RpoE activity)
MKFKTQPPTDMKIQSTALLLMAGLLALLNVPASAQVRPAPPEEVKRPDAPPSPERSRALHPPTEKPTAYLGVLTEQVGRELRSQFGLAEGFGLLVTEVMPESPAKEAGLKEHDVLVTFEDQKLVNMEQLQTLVRAKKKDDQVTLSIITGGQPKQVTIKIGERMMAVNQERPRGFMPGYQPGMRPGGDWGNSDGWRDTMEDFQRRMREYQERIQEWTRDGNRGQMPQPPMFDGSGRRDGDRREGDRGPRDGDSRRSAPPVAPQNEMHRYERRESHESANITRSDESGIYSLRREDGRQVFTVKPKDGEEKSWPVNNDEERAAVPEQFRSKLREMDEIRSNIPRNEGPSRDGERRPEGPREGNSSPPPAKRPTGA